MRKIVGSIIAVCFIQIGFQLYTAVEQTNFSFAAISANLPSNDSEALIADVEGVFQDSAAVDDGDLVRSAPVHRSILHRPLIASRVFIARTSPRPLFAPVVIRIPAQERYEFKAPKPQIAATVARADIAAPPPARTKIAEPKKTSTLARIVKKPYDFLKFVASKLN